jgi:hypothetical protein
MLGNLANEHTRGIRKKQNPASLLTSFVGEDLLPPGSPPVFRAYGLSHTPPLLMGVPCSHGPPLILGPMPWDYQPRRAQKLNIVKDVVVVFREAFHPSIHSSRHPEIPLYFSSLQSFINAPCMHK